MEKTLLDRSQTCKKPSFNRHQKKKPPRKIKSRQNDIYITTKSNFKAQQKQCEDLLNSGVKEIYLHCLGNAIVRGLNLALTLVNNSNDALTYEINTSTVHLIDSMNRMPCIPIDLCSFDVTGAHEFSHKPPVVILLDAAKVDSNTDEYHPLCDEDDISIQQRNNSAIHIKIVRNSVCDVDAAFSI